ncbi:MAG: DUF2244 domain-containing protein [Gammaproteobacteria bacterium]|nr:DUF2244 domain-containing protein [Gammaproteobacteria bacterium]
MPSKEAPHRLQVVPNCSLSWNAAAMFFAWTSAASLGIAVFFAVQGFWPILPFAGLEIMALGCALWISLQRGEYRELISVFPDRIEIEKGCRRQRQKVVFPLHWAHVNLRPARIASYPSRLVIGSHGRSCEVGKCLTESERKGLNRRLNSLIGLVDQTPASWPEVMRDNPDIRIDDRSFPHA